MSKTQIIPNHNSPIVQVKVFYAALNQYRNESLKELNKVENIILDKIRKHNILSKDVFERAKESIKFGFNSS